MIYRKRGHVVRWENGTLLRVTESGAAREEGALFECWPERRAGFSPPLPWEGDGLKPVLRFHTERLIVTRGYAEHEYGDNRWTEETHRFHASLVHHHLRALVDREEDFEPIASALQRAESEREAPNHLRLAPNVTAAVLPFLKQARQTAGGVDGYGNPVTETSASFYRPSYRLRPVHMPFNLGIEHGVTAIDEDLPRAVALLAPAGGLTLRVLIEDRQAVYPATISVTKIEAVARERVWYPYGAGSFGAEMML
ncbi:MAG TPA: hypothetical protein VEO54_22145 [Thermoanaerobaculia bacterium]|nr:hypothetical protein [Thermoanaerobaculia bacterium]